ncbi:MAG: alpha/beta hydrolase [Acidobacteria bacterium]|nr:alpha/beta hydrolase [Acidobacteriota bacterium]
MPSISQTTRFVEANGLRFEVTECGAGDRLALCLHGFPECAFSWRYQLPLLARLGYRVWAPNLRGYGRSSRPARLADYQVDRLVADVEGLIRASDARETLLIGHDWGGGIAWLTALAERCPLAGLIVINCPHPALFARGLYRWPQIRRSWYVFAFQIPRLPEWLLGRRQAQAIADAFLNMAADRTQFPDSVLDVYRRQALEPGALRAMVNYYRANRRFPHVSQPGLSRPVLVPTLLVWGEADTALGKELTVGTDQLVVDLTVRYLPGVSHWAQQEAPDLVNHAIEEWLVARGDNPAAHDDRSGRERTTPHHSGLARSGGHSQSEAEPEGDGAPGAVPE